MRILRFFADDDAVHVGVRRGATVLDLGPAPGLDAGAGGVRAPLSVPLAPPIAERPLATLRLDAPIRGSRKLLALAGNYRSHVVESGFTPVGERETVTPQVFWKPPTAVNRPGGAIALRPNNVCLDWEIELAVVIGRAATRVSTDEAMEAVFGYTAMNDISERRFNARVEPRTLRELDPFFDWLMGKWFDGSAPLGPEIVTKDEIPEPHDLRLRLWVNDELMQDGHTSQMIFRIPETIAYISSVVTLEPGDIIAMGTPDGVGAARGLSLKPGDRVRGEIEGIGVLDTLITAEAPR
ncbi:MAG: FAA hydrolase family protein [Luteitalea sp.]|nr:FAA hydrolase family protein [Luteitalea sp.]